MTQVEPYITLQWAPKRRMRGPEHFARRVRRGKRENLQGRAGKGENMWGGAKKRINQLIPRQRVFNVSLASGELGMVSK